MSLFSEPGHAILEPQSKCQSRIPFLDEHITLVYHFISENVQKKTFRVAYVSTNDQLADVLTKPLLRP
ncbi:hypothetical protein V2J09_018274 [Rumex salicifolius]